MTAALRVAPKVAVLLATYNGQRYLAEQLESFAAQTHGNWAVWASDDGSHDATLTILETYRHQWGEQRLTIHSGPARGFAANFMSLVCMDAISADYYAFSDQDDIWEPEKLARALAWLQTAPPHIPALYCSRTRLIDASNQEIGFSPRFTRPPAFANALVQSLAGGNTMVFNQAARQLLRAIGTDIPVVTHDWLTYLLVTGCGGRVSYDDWPSLRYRQHGANLVGMNVGWSSRLLRLRKLLQGQFKSWNDSNLLALQRIQAHLSPANRATLERFAAARKQSLPARLFGLHRSGVYRQTLLGNLGLAAAAVCGRI